MHKAPQLSSISNNNSAQFFRAVASGRASWGTAGKGREGVTGQWWTLVSRRSDVHDVSSVSSVIDMVRTRLAQGYGCALKMDIDGHSRRLDGAGRGRLGVASRM